MLRHCFKGSKGRKKYYTKLNKIFRIWWIFIIKTFDYSHIPIGNIPTEHWYKQRQHCEYEHMSVHWLSPGRYRVAEWVNFTPLLQWTGALPHICWGVPMGRGHVMFIVIACVGHSFICCYFWKVLVGDTPASALQAAWKRRWGVKTFSTHKMRILFIKMGMLSILTPAVMRFITVRLCGQVDYGPDKNHFYSLFFSPLTEMNQPLFNNWIHFNIVLKELK